MLYFSLSDFTYFNLSDFTYFTYCNINMLSVAVYDTLFLTTNLSVKYLLNKFVFLYYISILFWSIKLLILLSISIVSQFNFKHSSGFLSNKFRGIIQFYSKNYNNKSLRVKYITIFIKMYI